jgi:hypothetical protein
MGTTLLERFAVPVASFEFGLDKLPMSTPPSDIFLNKKNPLISSLR